MSAHAETTAANDESSVVSRVANAAAVTLAGVVVANAMLDVTYSIVNKLQARKAAKNDDPEN